MNRSFTSSLWLILTVSLLTIHFSPVEGIAKQIYYGGSDFPARAFNGWTSEYMLQNPNYTINYDSTVGDDGLNLLLNNTNVIASVDVPLGDDVYLQNPDLQVSYFYHRDDTCLIFSHKPLNNLLLL